MAAGFCYSEPATAECYTLSLHDALPIWSRCRRPPGSCWTSSGRARGSSPRSGNRPETLKYPPTHRSEEHTSELQSREKLVCRLLLEKKNRTGPTRHSVAAESAAPRPCPR